MAYDANSIVSLSQGRAFREKIGMYLSGDKQEAVNLGLRELIVNTQDEYEVYKPKNPFLKVCIDTKEKIISVSDNMRGIPCSIRDDGMNSLTAAMLINHSGGKHTGGAYESSVGVNGCGIKIVNHTAVWFEAEVKREGKIFFQRFESDEEGAHPTTEVLEKGKSNETGTKMTYRPDPKVYGDCFIQRDRLEEMLTEISYFSRGLDIILNIDGEEKHFLSKNGLMDGLNSKNAISNPFQYFYKTSDCEVELALQWVRKKGTIKGYANGLFMPDGGAFISGFKTSLTRTFNSLANKKFDGDAIRAMLDGFVSVKVKIGQFSNQAKTALANPEARSATSTAITEALKEFARKRPKDFEAIVVYLEKMERADEAAEKAREAILESTNNIEKNQKRKVFSSEKLKDAEFLGEQSTLLIVEGDSSASAVAQGRDRKHFGLLAIRGKMLNCLSNPEEAIFKNEEINLLLSAMNILPNRYDSSKLRYGKIAICSDADSDGFHIGLLIMSVVYKLFPQFLRENRLYWMRTPLYIVKNGKQEAYYFTDEEMDTARPTLKGEVTRAKGIGALTSEQVYNSMFNPKYQRLEQLCPTEESLELLQNLMGEDVNYRKDFIFSHVDFSKISE